MRLEIISQHILPPEEAQRLRGHIPDQTPKPSILKANQQDGEQVIRTAWGDDERLMEHVLAAFQGRTFQPSNLNIEKSRRFKEP